MSKSEVGEIVTVSERIDIGDLKDLILVDRGGCDGCVAICGSTLCGQLIRAIPDACMTQHRYRWVTREKWKFDKALENLRNAS